ncbi:serine protease [Photobacterium leiognathi]|uniref:serine protease n=1 Tax=Photobacterium leiognathi TaxID=553611 RepID=UPI0029814FB8|nr:trypsin-like serine protease [Photobacterium leiognathi]
MLNLDKIVLKVSTSEDSILGSAFLISANRAITAFHVIEEYQNEEIVLSQSDGKVCAARMSKKVTEHYKKLDIALLELKEPIDSESLLTFIDFETISVGTKWRTRGFPAVKSFEGDNILEHDLNVVNQQLKCPRNNRVDLELEHNRKFKSYAGFSGSPLVIDDAIAGILSTQTTDAGSSKELNALSIKYFKELIESEGLIVKSCSSPTVEREMQNLSKYTAETLRRVPSTIGGQILVERSKLVYQLKTEFESNDIVLLSGESGTGKSVLAKLVCLNTFSGKAIWLDNTIFECKNSIEVGKELGIIDFNESLINQIADENFLVVFDGLERLYSDHALAMASNLLNTLLSNKKKPKILITCQNIHLERIQTSLSQHFRPILTQPTFQVSSFTSEDLQQIAIEFPQFKKFFQSKKLQSLLARPKVIDLLTRFSQLPNIKEWGSEAQLIDWYWQEEIANKKNGAMREAFVLKLATELADSERSSVSVNIFSPSDLEVLSQLQQDGICTRSKSRISFEHDLLCDWFKQRVLISFLEDDVEYCLSKSESPYWYRAITLLGLELIENPDFEISWCELLEEANSGTDSKIIKDLLLESIIYCSQPECFIKTNWTLITANNAKLLKDLVDRFLYVATEPDKRTLQIAQVMGVDPLSASTWDRVPIHSLWPSLLKTIESKEDDFINLVPIQLVNICRTWLKHTPKGFVFRKLIARISLKMAWKALQQAQHYRWNSENRWLSYKEEDYSLFYEVALLSSYEDMDELVRLLHCACGLTEPTKALPSDKSKNSITSYEDRKTLGKSPENNFFWEETEVLEPIENGPKWSVHDKFCHFFLQKQNSLHFMVANPAEAANVILALCIREGGRFPCSSSSSIDRPYDLTTNFRVFPPLYNKGPFLNLLHISRFEGLRVILRLTEVATNSLFNEMSQKTSNRSYTSEQQDPITLNFIIMGEVKAWKGDRRWMHACRATTTPPKPLICALMALEYWLANKIDNQEDISADISYLLKNSNSLAIIGVIVQLIKRQPSLAMDCCIDLLSVPELILYDIDHVIKGEGHQMIGHQSFNTTESEWNNAKKWHLAKYRKRYFRDILITLFLTDSAFQNKITESVLPSLKQWLEVNSDDNQAYQVALGLVQRFTLTNWQTHIDENGATQLVFISPEEPTEEDVALAEKQLLTQEVLIIPMKCREILEKGVCPPHDDIESALDKFSSMELDEKDEMISLSLANTKCGLAAVLYRYRGELSEIWSKHETWCYTVLLETVFEQPKEQFAIAESAYSSGWDRFCADVLPFILAEYPEDKDVRAAVANLCIGLHYETVEHLFKAAAQCRYELGDDFYRLLHLAMIWSTYRHRILVSSNQCINDKSQSVEQLYNEFDYYYQGFLDATISPEVPPLRMLDSSFVAPLRCFEQFGVKRARSRSPGLDLEILRRVYSWLPDVSSVDQENERSFILNVWQQFVDIVQWQISDDELEYHEIDGTPFEFDDWVFSNLPKVIMGIDPEEGKKHWLPILRLGPRAHYWISSFFQHWFESLSDNQVDSDSFIKIWKLMLKFTETDVIWQEKKRYSSECDEAILGLDDITMNFIWNKNHSIQLLDFEIFYENYALNCSSSHSLSNIVRLLMTDSGKPLLPKGIVWIDRILDNERFYFQDDGFEDKLALLQKQMIEQYGGKLSKLPKYCKAPFLRVLKTLIERKNKLAMALNEKYVVVS